MIFELAKDIAGAIDAMPSQQRRRRLLALLQEAIRRDLHFISRHPTTLFQCLWNAGWWYDCPEAAMHYRQPEAGWQTPPPWQGEDRPLSALLESWNAQRCNDLTAPPWFRMLRPPAMHLGSPLEAVVRGHGDNDEETASHFRRTHGDVEWVAFCGASGQFVSASLDGSLRVWDAQGGQIHKWKHSGAFAMAPEGDSIAEGTKNGQIHLIDVPTGDIRSLPPAQNQAIDLLAFSPDGRRLAVVTNESLSCYDVPTRALQHRHSRAHRSAAPCDQRDAHDSTREHRNRERRTGASMRFPLLPRSGRFLRRKLARRGRWD